MGGVKKKSLASMEKSQDSQDSSQGQEGATEKGKKTKEQKGGPQTKKQLAFLVPSLSDSEMIKSLSSLKAVTVFGASRALGVNASVATGVLRDLETKKLLTKAGGFSGHSVWAVSKNT